MEREALEEYAQNHSSAAPSNLEQLERQVHLRLLYPRMCSGHLQGRLLKMLTTMIAPRRVLEVGTFAGYSALCIAEGLPPDGHLDTVEVDDELRSFIEEQLTVSPFGSKVTLHIADIEEIVPKLTGEYDMVYLDGNKRTYLRTFLQLLPLVRKGGYIVADNTLWGGKVADPDTKHDAQTAGICEFNEYVASASNLETVVVPLRDGITLIRKL